MGNKKRKKITETFSEEISAYKKISRSEFKKMIIFARKELRKGNKVIILAWKINRLTRNPRDNYIIEELLDAGCEFDFFEEPFSNDPAGRLVFRMFLAMAVHYSESLSSDIKGGQKTAIARGMYPGVAKIGYKKKEAQHIPRKANKEEAWKIKEVFERISDGESVTAVKNWAINTAKIKSSRGCKTIGKDAFYNIIRDPFYCGWFTWKGVLYKNGKHEKIINESLYQRVQTILDCPRKVSTKHNYLFSGIISQNGIKLQGTTNKGIQYYKNPKTGFHIREDLLEKLFIQKLGPEKIQEETIAEFKTIVKKILNIKESKHKEKQLTLHLSLGTLQSKLQKMQMMMIDEEITPSEYREVRNILELKIKDIEKQKSKKTHSNISESSLLLENALELLQTAKVSYKHLSKRKKALFIKSTILELLIEGDIAFFKPKKGAQALLELQLLPIGSP